MCVHWPYLDEVKDCATSVTGHEGEHQMRLLISAIRRTTHYKQVQCRCEKGELTMRHTRLNALAVGTEQTSKGKFKGKRTGNRKVAHTHADNVGFTMESG